MEQVGQKFLKAVTSGRADEVQEILDTGFPVNWRERSTGLTALYYAAGCRAKLVIDVLVNAKECDCLIRDKLGRLPSELAFIFGQDLEMATMLSFKERDQAEKLDLRISRRPVL